MEIIEINNILVNNKKINLLNEHLVHISESDRNKGYVEIASNLATYRLPLFGNKFCESICSEHDLQKLIQKLGLKDIDIAVLRLKIIDTKKWGKKPIYIEGADNVCFDFYQLDKNHFIIYNTSGTKAIEYLYIHGIWRSNSLLAQASPTGLSVHN
jgi:hypothetical protein